jgi:hypothetical protein
MTLFLWSYKDSEMGNYVVRMGVIEIHTNIMPEHLNERGGFRNLGLDGNIILKLMLKV